MRLIDSDWLLDKLSGDNPANMEDYYYNAIKEAPTIEAEPVVRCMECEYWGTPTENQEAICLHWSSYYGTIRTMDYQYCSSGERREK